ncbi:MAG: hypothetical protein IH886_12380 [Nitrospinae bacterium]|nr:hypothetical protein [Nitrospinota bacterium]
MSTTGAGLRPNSNPYGVKERLDPFFYRDVRLLPSLAPPLWWTLPANVATP